MDKPGTNTPTQLAQQLNDVHFGGNWTASNLKDNLNGVTWRHATTRIGSFHTIAELVFHINYFVESVLCVLDGLPLTSKDKFSFDHPPIKSEDDWKQLLTQAWDQARRLSKLVAGLPEEKLWDDFADPKYGTYIRNIQGVVEHAHYHVGQIVMLKVLIADDSALPIKE